jgi:hypothetical protein
MEKLANSEIFANSEITLDDLADSEYGAKFTVFFLKNCQFVSSVRSDYWRVVFTTFLQ